MADNEQDLTLRLQFVADTKAADEASKKIEDLGNKSDDAGKKQKTASESVKQFGQSSGRAAGMVGSLTGALGQASPAAAQLGAGLRVIKALAEGSGAGLMGLATILVGTVVSAMAAYRRKVEEAKKTLDEFIAAQSAETIKAGAREVDKIAEAFGRVATAISAARASQSELAAAWQDLNKAGQEVTAMQLEQREKAEMASVSPDDAAGLAKVKAKYTGIRESNALGQRAGDAVRAQQAAQDDLSAASSRRANIEEALASSISARDLRAGFVEKYKRRASPSNPDAADRKNAEEKLAGYSEQLASLNKSIVDLTDSLKSAKNSERSAGLRLEAANVRATRGVSAAQALAEQNTADAYLAATRATWSQRLTDLRGRASSASSLLGSRSASLSASAEAFNPQRSDYPHQGAWNQARQRDRAMDSQAQGAERLSASARKLNDQLSKMKPEQLATVFESISSQLAKLETAIKNAEQRSKRQ